MFIVDANVLIYTANASDPHHDAAQAWMKETMAAGHGLIGLPWLSLISFIRISSNPRIMPQAISGADATLCVERWLTHPRVITPEPTLRHANILAGLLRESGTAGNLTNDAHLAALCIEYGATMVSYDRDLARFGIPTIVP